MLAAWPHGRACTRSGSRVASGAVLRRPVPPAVAAGYVGPGRSTLSGAENGALRGQLLPAPREQPGASSGASPPRPWTHRVRTIALHPTDPEWLAVGIELG